MSPAQILLLVGLLVALGLAGYATYRYGWRWGLGVLTAGLGLLAGLWGMLRTLKPLPERPLPPRRPDAPLPEAEREREAVEAHRATEAEVAGIKAIDDDKARREAWAAAVRKRRGET